MPSCYRRVYDPSIPTSLTWIDPNYRGPWSQCEQEVCWEGEVRSAPDLPSRRVYACDEHRAGLERARRVRPNGQ